MGCNCSGRELKGDIYIRKYWQPETEAKIDFEKQAPKIQQFQSNTQKLQLMIVNGQLTESCLNMGQYKQAAEYCDTSIALARQLQCQTELCEWFVNLALIELRQGHHSKALTSLQEARRILPNNETVLKCYIDSLTWICLPEDQAVEAKRTAQTCVTISKNLGIPKLYLEWLIAYGIATKKSDPGEAKTWLDSALHTAVQYKDNLFQAIINNELGDILLELDKSSDAVSKFRNAVSKSRAINSLCQQARALYGLTRCYNEDNRKSFALKINYVTDLMKLINAGVEGYSEIVPDLQQSIAKFENVSFDRSNQRMDSSNNLEFAKMLNT